MSVERSKKSEALDIMENKKKYIFMISLCFLIINGTAKAVKIELSSSSSNAYIFVGGSAGETIDLANPSVIKVWSSSGLQDNDSISIEIPGGPYGIAVFDRGDFESTCADEVLPQEGLQHIGPMEIYKMLYSYRGVAYPYTYQYPGGDEVFFQAFFKNSFNAGATVHWDILPTSDDEEIGDPVILYYYPDTPYVKFAFTNINNTVDQGVYGWEFGISGRDMKGPFNVSSDGTISPEPDWPPGIFGPPELHGYIGDKIKLSFSMENECVTQNTYLDSAAGLEPIWPATMEISLKVLVMPAIIVPDVVGMLLYDAKEILDGAGFDDIDYGFICSDAEPGTVIYQSLTAGWWVPYFWNSMDLQVSGALVPDVLGMTESEAAATINTSGLVVGNVIYSYDDVVLVGHVIDQNPSAGTIVDCGSAVDLVVSLGSSGGGGGGGGCITIQDNFNDGTIDTSIWRNLDDDPIGENYPDRYPVERNGRLEIINNVGYDAAGLRTQINIPVDGYFQAQVSFNASECDEESGLSFSVHNFTTDYDHAVQYALIGNVVTSGRKWMVMKSSGTGDEDPVVMASESTSISTGVLYITYNAGIIDFSYTGYGEENAMYAVDISDWTGCSQVWLALTAWSDGAVLTGAGSYFDDFYLTTCNGGTASEQIEEILEFVDDSADAGDIEGVGPGASADKRLNALINMIQMAGYLIEDGFYEEAYQQLEDAYKKCDGQSPPPDFVEGDATGELVYMILSLMESL